MADSDLLTPVVPEDQWHPSFRTLISTSAHASARNMLREVWQAFPNPDPHFEREFQTGGFDARVWELCVFAIGVYGGFSVTRPEEAPDYLFERDGISAWVEVTTANPSTKWPVKAAESVDDLVHHMNDYLPIRLGNALTGKLAKEYWTLPHVANRPLIFALEDFSEDDAYRVDPGALYRYLWGLDGRVVSAPGEPVKMEYKTIAGHEHEGKVIPSGFFNLAGAEYISAVIFSCEGTIPKFAGMGFDTAQHPFLRMIRYGTCLDFDPTATVPRAFGYLVGDAPEEWTHGVSVYHNPRARHPLPRSFFHGFGGQHWIAGGTPDNEMRDFSPNGSTTWMLAIQEGAGTLAHVEDQLREIANARAQMIQGMLDSQLKFLAWKDDFIQE